jgi:hypothetical protein
MPYTKYITKEGSIIIVDNVTNEIANICQKDYEWSIKIEGEGFTDSRLIDEDINVIGATVIGDAKTYENMLEIDKRIRTDTLISETSLGVKLPFKVYGENIIKSSPIVSIEQTLDQSIDKVEEEITR